MPPMCYESLRTDSSDARRQVLKPGIDVLAEDAHTNQHDDRDGGDQEPILDDVLAGLVTEKAGEELHFDAVLPCGRAADPTSESRLGADGGDARGQVLEPGPDVLAENAHSDEDNDRD